MRVLDDELAHKARAIGSSTRCERAPRESPQSRLLRSCFASLTSLLDEAARGGPHERLLAAAGEREVGERA